MRRYTLPVAADERHGFEGRVGNEGKVKIGERMTGDNGSVSGAVM